MSGKVLFMGNVNNDSSKAQDTVEEHIVYRKVKGDDGASIGEKDGYTLHLTATFELCRDINLAQIYRKTTLCSGMGVTIYSDTPFKFRANKGYFVNEILKVIEPFSTVKNRVDGNVQQLGACNVYFKGTEEKLEFDKVTCEVVENGQVVNEVSIDELTF